MSIAQLREFLGWCSVINVALLFLSFVLCVALNDFVYKTHSKWFPMSREAFNIAMYSFIGIYKIFVIVFNVVPYAALAIM